MSAPPGYRSLDFSDEDRTDERLAQLSASGWVRGMFFQEIVDEAKRASATLDADSTYTPFHKYPLSSYIRLLQRAARAIHPSAPFHESLYRLGHASYPNFAESLAGKALFAVAAGDFGRVVSLGGRAYAAIGEPARVQTRLVGEREAVVHHYDNFAYPGSYQAGVVAGAMLATGVTGSIYVNEISLSESKILVRWN
ncbi:MAG: DUF2378 family protein [Myxococcota bacterium]